MATTTVSAALGSCQTFPTQSKPGASELAGLYVQTDESRENLRHIGLYKNDVQSKIRITQDGKIFLANIPDCWRLGTPKGGFDSSTGRWSLVKNDGKWQLVVMAGEGRTVELLNRQTPYELALVVGDPDQGEVIIFEKRGKRDADASQ